MTSSANKSTDHKNSNKNKQISTEFPFRSNFVEVHGSKIHYIDEGKGLFYFTEIQLLHTYGET